MKENKYDEERFFEKYSQMDRSRKGLQGAGEWPALEKMLPPFAGRDVLGPGLRLRLALPVCRRARRGVGAGNGPFPKDAGRGPDAQRPPAGDLPPGRHGGPGLCAGKF